MRATINLIVLCNLVTILLTIAWPSLVYLDFIFASSVPL
jgi:hypothetical protein